MQRLLGHPLCNCFIKVVRLRIRTQTVRFHSNICNLHNGVIQSTYLLLNSYNLARDFIQASILRFDHFRVEYGPRICDMDGGWIRLLKKLAELWFVNEWPMYVELPVKKTGWENYHKNWLFSRVEIKLKFRV